MLSRVLLSLMLIADAGPRLALTAETEMPATGYYRIKCMNSGRYWRRTDDEMIVSSTDADDDNSVFFLEAQPDGITYRIQSKADDRWVHYNADGEISQVLPHTQAMTIQAMTIQAITI